MNSMVEIVLHGRGGQGIMTAARLLAEAALIEGHFAQSFPEFGPERSGAPVRSYVRISNEPIDIRSLIYKPDIAVFIDYRAVALEDAIKACSVVANCKDPTFLEDILNTSRREIFYVDALSIAASLGDVRLQNSAMLGALVKATSIVGLSSLRNVFRNRFRSKEILELNLEALNAGYSRVQRYESA